MTGKKGGQFRGHSPAPVDDGAEDIENKRFNVGDGPHGFLPRQTHDVVDLLPAKISAALATSSFFSSAPAAFRLLQAILDLVQTRAGAGVVQLGAGSAGGADRPNDFVAELDDHAAAEEHHMRQLGERHQRVLLGAFP